MTGKKITYALLTRHGACSEQLALFARTFPTTHPNGVEVTRELCAEHAEKFEWSWAADTLLTEEASAEFDEATLAARKERSRVIRAGNDAYDALVAPIHLAFNALVVPARQAQRAAQEAAYEKRQRGIIDGQDYELAINSAFATYELVRNAAWKTREAAAKAPISAAFNALYDANNAVYSLTQALAFADAWNSEANQPDPSTGDAAEGQES
jgi:hypothetical protein